MSSDADDLEFCRPLNSLTSVIFVPNPGLKLARELAGQEYSGQTMKFTLAMKFEGSRFLFDLYSSFRPKPATAGRRRRRGRGGCAPPEQPCGGRPRGSRGEGSWWSAPRRPCLPAPGQSRSRQARNLIVDRRWYRFQSVFLRAGAVANRAARPRRTRDH